jgi:hypothetical protein
MSKKARRQRTPNLPPEAFNVPAAAAAPVGSDAQASAVAPGRKQAVATVDWQKEYGEVLGDLRRTFIIFAALVAAMVVLSFVIR